jgi:hypothetical protein
MNMAVFYHQGALMMEAASTSEMLVNFYQTTWCNVFLMREKETKGQLLPVWSLGRTIKL